MPTLDPEEPTRRLSTIGSENCSTASRGDVTSARRVSRVRSPRLRKAPEMFHLSRIDDRPFQVSERMALMIDSDVEIRIANCMNVFLPTADDTEAAIVRAEFVDEVPYCLDHKGLPIRLARRPSAWMMLVNVAKCRDRASSQFAVSDDTSIPEKLWAIDTGAQLMRTLSSAGEEVVATPASFLDSFRHFGGLSWVKI